jgi:hypothetical protein
MLPLAIVLKTPATGRISVARKEEEGCLSVVYL